MPRCPGRFSGCRRASGAAGRGRRGRATPTSVPAPAPQRRPRPPSAGPAPSAPASPLSSGPPLLSACPAPSVPVPPIGAGPGPAAPLGASPAAAMRSRSNSGVRLDGYARLVQQTILRHQVRVGWNPPRLGPLSARWPPGWGTARPGQAGLTGKGAAAPRLSLCRTR